MLKTRSQMLLEKFHESELESQVISLAEKVAKLGEYSKSIGLLDNLLQLAPKNPKKIAELAIKYQKAMDLKEKEEKKLNK